MKQKLLSLILTVAMLCSVFCIGSVTASAAETLPESYTYNVRTTDPADPTRGDYAEEPGRGAYEKGGHTYDLTSVLARWSALPVITTPRQRATRCWKRSLSIRTP